jgi:hypothetical protein
VSKKIVLAGVGLVVCVAVVLAIAGAASASYNYQIHTPDHSMVSGSVHDVSRALADANPCDTCHIPHPAQDAFLFARTQTAAGGGDAATNNEDEGVTSAIKPLCYSCHDGTGVNNGSGLATVFSTRYTNHRTHSAAQLNSAGAVYGAGRDCDLCHDPHDDGNTSFLRYERLIRGNWMSLSVGGNFCASCHSDKIEMAKNHPLEVAPGGDSFASRLPVDGIWSPAAGDYSGTRLYDPATHLRSVAANAVVECGSCHTPHGAESTASITTSDGLTYHSLNTMRADPDPADPSAGFLCLNCH